MTNVVQRFLGGIAAAAVQTKSLVMTGLQTVTVASGIVASTTHTLIGGTLLTAQINKVSTVANANDAVTLGVALGQFQDVYNDGAHAMTVYPPASGVAIDGGSAGASVTLSNGNRCRYVYIAANVIESSLLGAVSA
jgi:hypothetical protein